MGRRSLRRGSSFIINQQHKFMIQRDSYTLLKSIPSANQPLTDLHIENGESPT